MKLSPMRHRDSALYQTDTGHLVSAVLDTALEGSSIDVVVFNKDMSRVAPAYECECNCPAHQQHMSSALEEFLQSEELKNICENFDHLSVPRQAS